jgi:P27 family predicted phage terminase small subunit
MAGRKPKPTALKLLEGNRGRRPLNDLEPKPKVGEPEPLGSLTAEALDHFHALTAKLTAVRVLTVNDGPALSALAQSIADYEEASRELAVPGAKVTMAKNGLVRSPWAILQKQALDQMQRGFVDFGLTPSSRSKIQANPEAPEQNPFANLA